MNLEDKYWRDQWLISELEEDRARLIAAADAARGDTSTQQSPADSAGA